MCSLPFIHEIYDYILLRSDAGGVSQGREWDLYDDEAIGEEDELLRDRTVFTTAVKLLKLAVYAVTFCIVLGGGVISKATAIFMTSVVGKGRGFTPCNITGMAHCGHTRTFQFHLESQNSV